MGFMEYCTYCNEWAPYCRFKGHGAPQAARGENRERGRFLYNDNTAGMQWAKERIKKGRRFFPTRKGAIRKGNFTQNDKQRGKRDTYLLSACVVGNGRCALYELDHTSSIDSMFSPDSSSCLYLSAKMIPALQSLLNFSKSQHFFHPSIIILLSTYPCSPISTYFPEQLFQAVSADNALLPLSGDLNARRYIFPSLRWNTRFPLYEYTRHT